MYVFVSEIYVYAEATYEARVAEIRDEGKENMQEEDRIFEELRHEKEKIIYLKSSSQVER